LTLSVPRLIGHRGAKASAPENTLPAIEEAFRQGATWIEFDAKLTKDGVPILMHDETLDRTTSGTGNVAERTLAEIRSLDAGAWFGPPFKGTKVPTLEEAMATMARLGMGFNIEIKPCPGREAETARIACAEVERLWPKSAPVPVVSSFKRESLEAARDSFPHLPRGYLAEALTGDWLDEAEELACATIHPGWRNLTKDSVRAAKARNYPVLVWTVNEGPRARELLDWGVDAIITDAPAIVGAAIARRDP
jgi:glycerophosphoryl diester phosphodiesterase